MDINRQDFYTSEKRSSTSLYTLKNDNGMEVEIIEFGATVKSIKLPDGKGG